MGGRRALGERGSAIATITSIIGLITAIIGLVELLYGTDVIKGPSPIQRVERAMSGGGDEGEVVDGGNEPELDTESPSTPANVAASGACDIELSWSASSDNVGVAGYTVYRNGSELATVDAQTTTLQDAVESEGSNSYEVEAFDEAGNRSERSEPIESDVCIL